MRLKEESDEAIQLEKLFTMYQFESVEFFGVKDPIDIEWFSKNLPSVFKNVKILRKLFLKNQICESPYPSRPSLFKYEHYRLFKHSKKYTT